MQLRTERLRVEVPTNTHKNSDNEKKELDTDTPGQQTSGNGVVSAQASSGALQHT